MIQLCKFKISVEVFFVTSPQLPWILPTLKPSNSQIPTFYSLNKIHFLQCGTPLCNLKTSAGCHSISDLLRCHFPFLSTCCRAIELILLPGILQAPLCLRAFAHAVTTSGSAISHAFFFSPFGSFSSFKSIINAMFLEITFLILLSMSCPACYSGRLHSVYFLVAIIICNYVFVYLLVSLCSHETVSFMKERNFLLVH